MDEMRERFYPTSAAADAQFKYKHAKHQLDDRHQFNNASARHRSTIASQQPKKTTNARWKIIKAPIPKKGQDKTSLGGASTRWSARP
jgi:hypothetical protein